MNKKGKTGIRVPYAQTVYGREEIVAVNRVLSNPSKIVAGPAVKQFEKKISDIFGKKHGIFVNSGSSANLLAIDILDMPRGSEVITPVLTFATTVAPLVQKGLVPVFVDVVQGTYQIDINKIESLITKKTKALMIPSLIGNISDMAKLRKIADKYKLWFIEDSCDTLGAKFAGKPSGFYSDITTTSFYASHIITAAGLGGMLCINNGQLARQALIKANWGRESTLFGVYEKSEELKRRMAGKIDGKIYDAKFIFSEIGYNFQVTELNGAFGLEQLKRFPEFTRLRRNAFVALRKFFKQYEHFFILPETNKGALTTWLAFPLTIREGAPFTRTEIITYLEENNIQTRPIFTGNITKQDGFKNIKSKKAAGGYPVANHIMHNGFLIGCHQGLTKKHLDYLIFTFEKFLTDK